MSICMIYSSIFFFFSFSLFSMSINFLVKELVYFFEINLMTLNSVSIEYAILIDWMSLLFMSFVLFISSMVIFYSESYMSGELNLGRFVLLVVLFVFSMVFLIISPNLISILLGWDGLGLVSYCLVIFYQNVKSFNAGMLTALSNRVGDVMLLMSIAWMMNYGSWNYIFYLDFFNTDFFMVVISFFVLLAAMTKSAQIPFSSWLPAAMAAPTPVSALVHSSTLVTAGVYLLIRFNVIVTKNFFMFLLFIGLLTMFMSGVGANFEYDLKKIIALSTLSQLGFMMSILSLGGWMLAFYHLLVHALFKALLFMCAGNMIHNLLNCQDIRFMGCLYKNMPLTVSYFNISNLSLCGLPFFSGFYSKDLIVEFMSMDYFNLFVYLIFYISIGLTVSYSFRLSYYSIMGLFNFFPMNLVYEDSMKMLKSMGFMLFMTLFSGSLLMWLIFDVPYLIVLPFIMKIATLILISMGIFLGLESSKMSLSYSLFSIDYKFFTLFFSSMWNLPFLSTLGLNYIFIKSGAKLMKFLDQGWVEYIGGQNLFFSIQNSSIFFQYFLKNNFKLYLILLISWVVLLIIYSF
uniref:NADH dehydrogenase subunit 5 n=1 Tax=Epiverta chelonia TaxID=1518448 RepID=UPI00207A2DC9|nr:NADH dehydrogenase subunit 5 [Epiverta chelonia]URN72939.1 NADH dehydrogenase subunit 5 [Epiverta chelonia]